MPAEKLNTPDAVERTLPIEDINVGNLSDSLERIKALTLAEALYRFEKNSRDRLHEMRDLQKKVNALHKLTKLLNNATTKSSELDFTNDEEIKRMIFEAKGLGVELDETKFKHDNDSRIRLLENINMTIEDYNKEQNLLVITMQNANNQVLEAYKMASEIESKLDDDKKGKNKAILPR